LAQAILAQAILARAIVTHFRRIHQY